ncbi:MAG: hypothetical protein AAGE94_00465 [Acidobacteriota bacterium]
MTLLSLRPSRALLSTLLSIATLVVVASPLVAGSATLVVDETNAEWGFLSENVEVGFRAFGAGPSGVPIGESSVHFQVDGQAREILGTANYNGTLLSTIDTLSYSTYRFSPDSGVLAISLQFNVDYDTTDMDESWQGRLVFEPYLDGSMITPGVWQTWDALAGLWWSSGAPGNTVCPQHDPCTWAEVQSSFPQAGVHATLGAMLLKAGGPWSDFYGAVDNLTIGFGGVDTTFDFESANLLFFDGFEIGNTSAWTTSTEP